MSEFEERTEALRQALLAGKENEKKEVTIARAEAFLAFLTGRGSDPQQTLNRAMNDRVAARKRPAAKAQAAPRKRGRPRKVA